MINVFISVSVLCHYDSQQKLWMKTNVSEAVYANILSQLWKNEWYLIMYFSRKFNNTELNYSIYDKELMTIVMSFKQWRHYLENVSEIEVWSDHANLKQFMSQTILNDCQVCWLIQLTSYDFTIQYHQDSLNPADESSQRPDYIAELSREHEDSMSEQINNLILILVNKLATVVLIRADRQYSCQVRSADSKTEDLIQVLSLQTITWSKTRLAADNLESYRKTNDLNYRETNNLDFRKMKSSTLHKSELNDLDIVKNKSSILSLIKDVQEFDLLCRWISS